jgi:hypothetical protein
MAITYSVSVWTTQKRYAVGDKQQKKPTRYVVRWLVDGKRQHESFKTAAAADSFRSDLVTAVRKGEPFDTDTGRPVVERAAEDDPIPRSWLDLAKAFTRERWPELSPGSRRNMAGDLTARP